MPLAIASRPLSRIAAATLLIVGAAVVLGGEPAAAADCSTAARHDFDGDGSPDVVVGDPDATVDGQAGAGRVHVIYSGTTGTQTISQTDIGGEQAEAGDRFGYSVAADVTTDGKPFVVVGAPGDAVGSLERAGIVSYIRPDVTASFHQDAPGVFGIAEAGDQFGYAVAASSGSRSHR